MTSGGAESSTRATSIAGEFSRDTEVDLGQLFSDVSRTVGNLKNILNAPGSPAANPVTSKLSGLFDSERMGNMDGDGPSPLAKLFGGNSGVCFKTCGMEDIQFAARRAGELFMTLKVCTIIFTLVVILCALLLTATLIFYLYKNRDALRQIKCSLIGHASGGDESGVSVTPLIFSKRSPPMPSGNAGPPKPPAHQTLVGLSVNGHSPACSSD